MDVRELVVNKLELNGGDRSTGTVPYGIFSSIVRTLSVTEAFVHKIWRVYCTSDSLLPKKQGPLKGFRNKITDENHEYIKLLVSLDPTIYHSEICKLLIENSNSINDLDDVSSSTVK